MCAGNSEKGCGPGDRFPLGLHEAVEEQAMPPGELRLLLKDAIGEYID